MTEPYYDYSTILNPRYPVTRESMLTWVWASTVTYAGPVDGDIIAIARADIPKSERILIDVRARNRAWPHTF